MICPRCEDCQYVAWFWIGKGYVPNEDVALAMLARNSHNLVRRSVRFVGNNSKVTGTVKGRSGIVAHPAIN